MGAAPPASGLFWPALGRCVQVCATQSSAMGLFENATRGMRRERGACFMKKTVCYILGAAALTVASPALSSGVQGPRGDEPVAVPRSIKQGVDFVYVDPAMSTVARRHQRPQNWFARLFSGSLGGGGSKTAPNPLFAQL